MARGTMTGFYVGAAVLAVVAAVGTRHFVACRPEIVIYSASGDHLIEWHYGWPFAYSLERADRIRSLADLFEYHGAIIANVAVLLVMSICTAITVLYWRGQTTGPFNFA